MLGGALPVLPASTKARLFAAFGLEMIYNKQDHQVTIYATITPSTPKALADIIAGSEPSAEPAGLAHSRNTPECDRCATYDKRVLIGRPGPFATPLAGVPSAPGLSRASGRQGPSRRCAMALARDWSGSWAGRASAGLAANRTGRHVTLG